MALVLLGWNVFSLANTRPAPEPVIELPYSAFLDQLDANNVSAVGFQGNAVSGGLKTAITYPPPSPAPAATAAGDPPVGPTATGPSEPQPVRQTSDRFTTLLPDFGDPALLSRLRSAGVAIDVTPVQGPSVWLTILVNLLPWVLFAGVFVFISRRAGQAQQGMFAFGKSKAKRYEHPEQRTTFADVAGVEESKADLLDIIDYLREPAKYQRLGGRVPRGVLLVGPPGTGKTLLARATAGEANVPFFSISGPEFVEVLVGVGASRVRDLFETAKKQGPSIIFIDEIDAIGRRRGAGAFTHEEREQTLNQILVEMDGFDANHTVIVLAATNRSDVLDPALLRPGRFDRQVAVDPPDKTGREAILTVHVKGVPLAPDVELGAVARATPGMVGADLANLVNEAALLGARRALPAVDQRCFWDALERIQLGAARPLVLSEADRRIVAYHEGGHALVALLSPDADPLNRVTIVPRGHALGLTLQLPIDDRYNYSKAYLLARVAVALAGRVAEELVFGEITTGAESDLDVVTKIVRQMVTRWGMDATVGVLVQDERLDGDLGWPTGRRETSEYTARRVDRAMREIVDERLVYTRALLSDNRDKLDRLAGLLLDEESVDAERVRAELGLPSAPSGHTGAPVGRRPDLSPPQRAAAYTRHPRGTAAATKPR
ncbi:MAG TPA: ATP-dependent zinc metalloprotease FtsH [Chloroflexota bacterium]